MRIIYYSYWGTYAAYTMAALHTGIYPADSLPPREYVAAQYELCCRYGEQAGNLIFVGLDDQLREVYSLGCRQHGDMIIRAINNINIIFDIREPVSFFSAEKQEGMLPGLLQRLRLNRNSFTEDLFYIWFRKHYANCRREVQYARESLKDGIVL
ncbi:MAG TPA: DUF3189 family protein [Clostridiales bacterium]|nr:DUF3189 family protein [Clostridiales bacterium]